MRIIKTEKILFGIIICLTVILVFSMARSAFGNVAFYETELARYDTLYLTDTFDGYVIMDDWQISSTAVGTAIPVVPDGTKVDCGGEIVRIFKDVDYAAYIDESNDVQSELDYYSKLQTTADAYVSNIPVYNSSILRSVTAYASAAENGSVENAAAAADDVREYLTVKQIVMGKTINVDEKVAELESELERINDTNFGSQYSSITLGNDKGESGYYFSYSDGFENRETYARAEQITCSDIRSLMDGKAQPVSDLGKIVHNPVWYFVCAMTKQQAAKLSVSGQYDVTFRDSSAGTVPMRVNAINEDPDTGEISVIFSAKIMNEDIASLRKVTADVCFSSYSGVLIPNTAIRTVTFTESEYVYDENNVMMTDEDGNYLKQNVDVERVGVFIRFNNVAKFRRINILYRDSKVCIAELVMDNSENRYVKINDEIFTEGVNLKDENIVRGGYF